MKPKFIVNLFNNPPCDVRLESIVKREVWEKRDGPHLDVHGTEVPDGQASLAVQIQSPDGNVLFQHSQKILVKNGQFVHRYELDSILKTPSIANVSFKSSSHSDEQTIPIVVHRLYGRITDFEGNAYVMPMGAGNTVVKADANGFYEVWLPAERLFKVFVCDERYSKETLECWLWDLSLQGDLRLNMHIGSLELYRIHAWMGECVVYVHFIPMSLGWIRPLVDQGRTENEIAATCEAHPRLREEDVEVLVDGKICPIKMFAEHPDYLFVKNGKDVSRPGYLLSIEKQSVWAARDGIIQLRVTHRLIQNEEEIIEQGEGYFLGFYGRPETKQD